MASKEVMVTAPVLVFLYDWAFVAGTLREAWKQRRNLHLILAGTWLILAYLMAHAHLGQRNIGFGTTYFTWQTYALTECKVVVNYLKLAFWPHPLVFDYGTELRVRHVAAAAPYALLLIVLGAGTLLAWRRRPALGFLGGWFFLILAPSSSVVPLGLQPMAESRLYVPLAAAAAFIAATVYAWLGRKGLVLLLALTAGCGWLTVRRNADYRSEVSLWTDTVNKRPGSSRAHFHLASALQKIPGQLPEVVAQYEAVLRIDPDYAEAHNNLGNVLLGMPDRLPDAIKHYETALRLMPDNVLARNNLGCALMNVPGRLPDAVTQLEAAVKLKPEAAELHDNLATALSRLGRRDEAVEQYQIALRLNPDDLDARDNLGSVLMAMPGRLPEAIAQFKVVLSVHPDSATAHYNLGVALLRTPETRDEAIAHFQEALRLQPDLEAARQVLTQLHALNPRAP